MNILIKLEHDLPPTPPILTPYKPKTKVEESPGPPAYRPFKIDRSRIIVKTSCDVDDDPKNYPSSEDSLRVLG
jgi:hypothetical protein